MKLIISEFQRKLLFLNRSRYLEGWIYTLLLRGFRICTLMVSGLEIRMNRIMNQGRMLCIPMDHGISNGPIPGLEDPHGAIAKCANHGLTSVIINKGVLKSMPKFWNFGSFFISLYRIRPRKCKWVSHHIVCHFTATTMYFFSATFSTD